MLSLNASRGVGAFVRTCQTPFRGHQQPRRLQRPFSSDTTRRTTTKAAENVLDSLKQMFSRAPAASEQQGECALETGVFFSDNAPSWEELAALAEERKAAVGFRDPDLENGPAHPRSLLRLFGEKAPKLKLYRDHAAWCPYCEKVWLQLEEKRIPYEIEKINMRCYGPKPSEFMAKVPSGLLPVLEVDGEVITESDAIMARLEAAFPEYNPLLPAAGSESGGRVRDLLRLERRLFGDWLRWLTSAWSNDANCANFEKTMDAVNAALTVQEGPYFLDDFSLVDCVFAPFLERIAASILYYKGFFVRGRGRWPAIDAWFVAMEGRETYLGIKSDIFTHVKDLPPQIGGCASIPEAEAVAGALDGSDGRGWHLPLYPLSSSASPEAPECHTPGERPEYDAVQAGARLVENHEAVVKFSLRGPSAPGQPPVSAPLADPNALPAMEYHSAADAGLRHVAQALLLGVEVKQAASPLTVSASQPEGQPAYDGGAVQLAAGYLRDRVGVPRDLPLPAGRQLRAHCNWLVDHLQGP